MEDKDWEVRTVPLAWDMKEKGGGGNVGVGTSAKQGGKAGEGGRVC